MPKATQQIQVSQIHTSGFSLLTLRVTLSLDLGEGGAVDFRGEGAADLDLSGISAH